jgi:hypothetical protein
VLLSCENEFSRDPKGFTSARLQCNFHSLYIEGSCRQCPPLVPASTFPTYHPLRTVPLLSPRSSKVPTETCAALNPPPIPHTTIGPPHIAKTSRPSVTRVGLWTSSLPYCATEHPAHVFERVNAS